MIKKPPSCLNGHTDHIIPIIYGMPTEKTMEKAVQGKVHLGGCIIEEGGPKYYCTLHNKEI